ncbi:hypothetical protein ADIARSV_1823 [Arcticibacter svalbardensis MN12-7]|uniref:SprT-like domain-containing protein n=1 Tax=Arcticibacter svalbardensis MN12-7 TaxID=1150600 RepID=R9H1E1_9SPHI|nr:SprT-like domain-containing protein [Arcticibacter svalbardensis]EOR95039.1 hypothetical protein ADIARSV_1823 [Arcticibacter svalbardensis MN12-7]
MDKVKILAKYMPEQAAPVIARWIDHYKCDFKVSVKRSTKMGDYRAPFKGQNHRISVNHDLNPYGFLITTVHEFAHLLTWNENKNKVKPHGAEWKTNFKRMMQPFFDMQLFPDELHQIIVRYLQNPAASSCSDLTLFRALQAFNATSDLRFVESLPVESSFMLKNRLFKKGNKIRTRFSCVEVSTGKIYLFHPMAQVVLIAPADNKD